MRNIFKMDMHRLLHSKVFYVSLAFLLVMAVAMPLSGMATDAAGVLGATSGVEIGSATAGNDFMTSAMGTGVTMMLLGIILTLFVCGDYAGGFAKNIFTAHSNPKDYIGGKLLSMSLTSGLLLVFYTIVAMIALVATGNSLALAGGVFGLIAFLLQKWIISVAFIALILLVTLFTRNTAVGIIAGFLVATGGLTMGITMFGQMFGIDWFSNITQFTVSGASALPSLSFSALTFVQVLLTCAVWVVLCFFLSRRMIKTKDI